MRSFSSVEITQFRFRFLPAAFVWRGERYPVMAVLSISDSRRHWPRRRESRRFRVLTPAGILLLRHDLIHNLWEIGGAAARPSSRQERRFLYANRAVVVR